jgi:hypothetical protein
MPASAMQTKDLECFDITMFADRKYNAHPAFMPRRPGQSSDRYWAKIWLSER